MKNDMAKGRILLVEDDGTLRKLYSDILEDDGFEVEEAVEGKQGLEKARSGGFDLILLDILLPGIKGQDILRQLKDDPPQQKNGPKVMLTNQAQQDILEECRQLGAQAEIIKSQVTPEKFLELVNRFIEGNKDLDRPQS